MTRLQHVLKCFLYPQLKLLSKHGFSRWCRIYSQISFSSSTSHRVQISKLCSSWGSDGFDQSCLSSKDLPSNKDEFNDQETIKHSVKESSQPELGFSPNITCGQNEDLDNSIHNDSSSALRTVKVVPGKGSPPDPPTTCCGTGCANCVWIVYAEELREYYKDGGEQAKKAIEKIDDPSLKMFIKLELGLL